MRHAIAFLVFLALAPAHTNALDNTLDVRTISRPAFHPKAAVGILAPTNQFDGFVRFSAERQFFEPMAENKAYFRDVLTGGDTFHDSPNDGDSFSARLFGPNGSLITTWTPIVFRSSFNGQQDCWVDPFSGTICGTTSIFVTWFIRSQCFADGTYRMEFLSNSQPFFSGMFQILPEIPPDSLPANLGLWNQGAYDGSDPARDHYDKRCYVTDPNQRHDCDGRAGEQKVFIKKLGCFLSSSALVTTYHGLPLAPTDLNTVLNNTLGGYDSGNVQPDKVASQAAARGLDLSFLGRKPFADLLQNICRFGPQLVGVKCSKGVAGHWVVATGIDRMANSFKIVDPSGGQLTTLAKYNNTSCGTRVFTGPEFVVLVNSKIFTSFHSPVDLLLTDPLGRRLGRNATTGLLFEEIPDAYYDDVGLDDDETGEPDADPPKQLFLPRPVTGNYTVTATGTADGSYSADFVTADANGVESRKSLADIPIGVGNVHSFTFHYDSAVGSVLQLVGGFDGGGQRPRDVNRFLSYGNPSANATQLAAGTQTFPLLIFYAAAIDPITFSAELNGTDVTALFHPEPGKSEVVELALSSGRNVLKVSIDGSLPGRVATDTDRLVFQVP